MHAIQKPNYILLMPITSVILNKYPISCIGSSEFLVLTDLVVFVIYLVDLASKVAYDLFLLLSRFYCSSSES